MGCIKTKLRRATAFSALAALLLPAPAAALEIHDYQPERHDRFETGSFPDAPVPNNDSWTAEFDFSGVGWSADDPRKGFALISPRHFVGARHFRPALDSEIVFMSPEGELRSFTYVRFYTIKNDDDENTDLFIGELAEDIPASHNIAHYPVLDKPESELTGSELIVYGRGNDEPRFGRGVINGFGDSFSSTPFTEGPLNDTRHYTFNYRENSAGQDDAYFELGDSGSPSFILYEGELTVSGIHSAVEDNSIVVTDRFTSYDSFILHYRDQIDDHLAATGHQLSLVPREEPEQNGDGETTDDLKIKGIEIGSGTITLTIHNPSATPFEVQRNSNLDTDDWETIATGQEGETWTGDLPQGHPASFWRLRY